MGQELCFVVPGEPKGLARAKVTIAGGHARMYDPAKNRDYKGLIRLAAAENMANVHWTLTDKAVFVEIKAYFTIPASWSKKKREQAADGLVYMTKKPDADNIIKMVLDAVNTVAITDDKNVIDVHCYKSYSDYPRLEVFIWEAQNV